MFTRHDRIRRHLSWGLSLLMLTLSGAVPLMDSADFDAEPVAESEHSPADCPVGHDHRICTQVGANLSAPTAAHQEWGAPGIVRAALTVTVSTATSATSDPGHQSRAPPRV